MYGLMLLGIALVYIALAGWLIYKVKRWSRRMVIAVVAILIPNADDWYYRYQLAQYCKNEAGYKVYEQVSRREGVVFQGYLLGENFTQVTPLAFIEGSSNKANDQGERVTTLWRSDRRPDGTATPAYPIKAYTAAYELAHINEDYGSYVDERYVITHRPSGRLIAEIKGRAYLGTWLYPRLIYGGRALLAGCGVPGQADKGSNPEEIRVLSRHEWQYRDDSLDNTEKLIRQTFTKD